MAAEPQSCEPEKLTAGMTWTWSKTISDHPVSEWTLTYYLRINGSNSPRKNCPSKGICRSSYPSLRLVKARATTPAPRRAAVDPVSGFL